MGFKQRSETPATALITGASAGLGAEYARQLAKRGYNLVLTARRLDRLESLANELHAQYGISATCLSADLSHESGIFQLERQIKSLANLEILVNNAGFGLHGGFEQVPVEDTLSMIQVHILSVVRLTYAALPIMRRRQRGWIINISSMSAFFPVRNVSYSATKAFLVNFSEALETELIGSGVHAQALCPGFTYTEFHDSPELSGLRKSLPAWMWLNAGDVVRDSLDHLERNTVIVVPGLLYKFAYIFVRSPLFSAIIRKISITLLSRKNAIF